MGFPKRLLARGEEMFLDLRPHWVALVPPIVVTLLIVAGLVAALMFMPDDWPEWPAWAVAVILLIAYPVRHLVAWATSHFVVTSERIIHREGWFAKRSMEIPLENINDVRFNQTVFERILGAGDLRLESAGEFGQQRFTDIRDPEQVQKVIYELSEENKRRMYHGQPVQQASVAEELAKLDALRDQGVITEAEFQAQKGRLLGTS